MQQCLFVIGKKRFPMISSKGLFTHCVFNPCSSFLFGTMLNNNAGNNKHGLKTLCVNILYESTSEKYFYYITKILRNLDTQNSGGVNEYI